MLIWFFQIPKILVIFFYTRLHENELWLLEWYNLKVHRIPPVDIPSRQHFVSMSFRRTFWCDVVMLLPIPLESVCETISNWFENYKPHRAQISTSGTLLSLKLEKNGLQCWPQPQVFWAYFFTLAIFKDSKATSRFFSSQCSDDENWLDFSCIFYKIWGFRSPTFHCMFIPWRATLDLCLTVAWLFLTKRNSLRLVKELKFAIATFAILLLINFLINKW